MAERDNGVTSEQTLGPIELCTICRAGEAAGSILWDCLPVPCFGNPDHPRVRVVTVALNPSSWEFYDGNDNAKPMAERLPMVGDFGVRDRSQLLTTACTKARDVRNDYFSNKPHSWFTPMQMMLRGMNLNWSYAEGTAVQIDIVACATKPLFGDLSDAVKKQLERNCRPYLTGILSKFANGTWLVVNGRTAFNAVTATMKVVPNDRYSIKLSGNSGIQAFVGEVQVGEKTLPYFGWNKYLHRCPMNEAGAILDYWRTLPARM